MRSGYIFLILVLSSEALAEQFYDPSAQQPQTYSYEQYEAYQYSLSNKDAEKAYDFEHEDAYIDILDAMKSRKFVQRVILKEAIADSSHFELGRFYINHLMGYTAVHQEPSPGTDWIEYSSAVQAIAAGYALSSGHALEAGFNFSAISEVHIGYRYFLRLTQLAVWPFAGGGVGMELQGLELDDGPFETDNYTGTRSMFYVGGGLLMPLLDVGLKMEGRLTFYGSRLTFMTGIGLTLFF